VALDDDAVMIAGEGHIFLAPKNTPIPASLTAPASPWWEVGHTSREDPFAISKEGGEAETRGTWQKPNLRSTVTPITYTAAFPLLQYDEASLKLFYGGGTVSGGRFWVPRLPTPQEHAMFVRIVDGTLEWNRHFPAVSIIAGDSESIAVDDFASMPVNATILDGDEAFAGLFSLSLPAA